MFSLGIGAGIETLQNVLAATVQHQAEVGIGEIEEFVYGFSDTEAMGLEGDMIGSISGRIHADVNLIQLVYMPEGVIQLNATGDVTAVLDTHNLYIDEYAYTVSYAPSYPMYNEPSDSTFMVYESNFSAPAWVLDQVLTVKLVPKP